MEGEELSLNSAIPFAGRYILKKQLGSGGMGSVYLAVDSMLGDEEIAIKVLHAELCKNEKHTKRFLREVQLTRKVTHPNVVRTFDAGRENGRLFFTMEYAPGVTLKEKLAANPIEPTEVASILREIAKGLYAIHQADIIHRDLKPGNVILTPDGFVKITDFGVAKPGVSDLTGHNEIIGSIPYMAPEVWVGRNVGPLADVYALGVLAFEMLTGVLPFDGDSPAEMMCKHLETRPVSPCDLAPGIPHWLNELVLQMLEKDQDRRPAGAEAIVKTINHHLDGHPAPSAPQPDPESGEDEERLGGYSPVGSGFEAPPPAMDSEPSKSDFELRSAPLPVAAKLIAMPAWVEPDPYDFAALPKRQQVLRHCLTFLAGFLVCWFCLWRFEGSAAPWIKGLWSVANQVTVLRTVGMAVLSLFLGYALIFSLPVFLLACLRRSLPAACRIWAASAAVLFLAMVVLMSVQTGRLEVTRSKIKVDRTREEIFASAQAAVLNVQEIALLMPRGTVYVVGITTKNVILVENHSPRLLQTLVYYGALGGYALFLVFLIEKAILTRRIRSVELKVKCFFALFVCPMLIECALLAVVPALRELFAMRDVELLSGPLSFNFDHYSLICSGLNWLLVVAAVVWIVPFYLKRQHAQA